MLELNEINNPFPGIRPFEMDETNLFFGRDGQSDELLKRMQRTRLLAVVGTSGSGKSSLIRAGLLPALYGGLMGAAGSSWRIAILRPGGDPMGNLAIALDDPLVFGSESNSEIQTALIETTLRRSSIGLIDVTRQARMSEHENLLVVVDQFEELFRFKQSQSSDDATTFVKLLLEASAQQEIPIYIIITMRSDFLGDCSQFTGLPEAINNGQYLIPRMSRDERQSAIVGPIAVGEGQISAPLVSRLLNDVGDNPDQLPILQHALMRTWDYWSAHRLNGDPIDLDDYNAIGTMSEALSRHADEAFNELPGERSRLIAEQLFKRLTEKGADNREIRRPTPLAELCAVCQASEAEIATIVDVFRSEGRSFLMPPAGTKLISETVIDISHESLIRNWTRLQQWVDEEAQSSRTYRRLAEAAVLHCEGHEGLLQDPGLQISLDWFEKNKPNAAWAQRYHAEFEEAKKYLEASCEAREAAERERERQRNAELEFERRQKEQAEIYAAAQARTARRLRSFTFALVVISLLAIMAAGASVFAFARARKSQTDALLSQSKAEIAQKKAEGLAADLKTNFANLQAEKAKADQLALDLGKETDKTKLALKAQEEAVAKQVKAFIAQRAATKTAQENEQLAVAAKERGELIRSGLEASRRDAFQDAYWNFSNLITNLEEAIKNAEANRPADLDSLRFDLGWAHLHFGKQQRGLGNLDDAIKNLEEARSKLTKRLKVDEAKLTTEPIKAPSPRDPLEAAGEGGGHEDPHIWTLFEAYDELAHAYYDKAKQRGDDYSAKGVLLSKAEEFYTKALAYQILYMSGDSEEAAAVNQNLARLHSDQGQFDKAEKNFKRAVEIYKGTDEVAKGMSAVKDLAEFYRDQSRYQDAAGTYLQLIDLQETKASAPEVADSYSDLGQIYTLLKDDERAAAMFQLAEKLQQYLLRFKRELSDNPRLESADDFDALGDAYVRAGRFEPAREQYENSLHIRQLNHTVDQRWVSYEKLANLYLDLKDYDKAEENLGYVVDLLKATPNDHYVDALTNLGALYAMRNRPDYAAAQFNSALAVDVQSYWARYRALTGLADLYRKQQDTSKLSETYDARLQVAKGLLHEKANVVAQKAVQGEYAAAAKLYLQAVNDLTGISADSGVKADPEKAFQLIASNRDLSLDSLVDVAALETYAHTLETYLEWTRKNPPPPTVQEAPALLKRARDKLADINAIRQQQSEQYRQTQQRRAP